jgi:uncharacterized delta-60 repeat protein
MKKYLPLFFLLIHPYLFSQPQFLDTTFGNGGKIITDFSTIYNNDDYGYAVKQQVDGKLIVAGSTYGGFAIVRYNNTGDLDTAFGSGGKVITPIGGLGATAFSIAIQTDGKIMAAGNNNNASSDFALVRYNNNGTLDSSFGSGGKVTTPIGNDNDYIMSIAIQADGKIVAAGSSNSGSNYYANYDFALARYNMDGTLDLTFGVNGKSIIDFGADNDCGNSVLIQADKKIIVVGSSQNDIALARYNVNGTLDATFGNSGKVRTHYQGSADWARSAELQTDGKILVAGMALSSYWDYLLMRYDTNGTLDNTFGDSGKVVTDFMGYNDEGHSVVIQNDGKIIVAGKSNDTSNIEFSLARYNYDGTLDSTFGYGGKITTSIDSWDYDVSANSIIIQDDGKIVLGGWRNLGGVDFCMVRYNINTSVGIKERSKNSDVSIYPNPSSGIFIVQMDNCHLGTKVAVRDILGNYLFEKNCRSESSQEINLSFQPRGIYFLEVISSGEKVVKKIVLE